MCSEVSFTTHWFPVGYSCMFLWSAVVVSLFTLLRSLGQGEGEVHHTLSVDLTPIDMHQHTYI